MKILRRSWFWFKYSHESYFRIVNFWNYWSISPASRLQISTKKCAYRSFMVCFTNSSSFIVCVYGCVCIRMFMYVVTCTKVPMCTYVLMCTYVFMSTYVYVHIYLYIHMCKYIVVCIYINICIHVYAYVCVCTCIYILLCI